MFKNKTTTSNSYLSFSQSRRFVFSVAVLFTAFGTACYSYARQIETGGDNWLTGDWLINYSGGFVRRGLFGEIYRTVFPHGQLGLWCLFFFQSGLYALVLIFFVSYLIREKCSWASIALVCNPAAFAFIGWDSRAFARKESIGFLCLIIIVHSKKLGVLGRGSKYFGVSLYIASIFISEVNVLLLPSIVYLLANSPRMKQNRHRSIFELTLVVLTSMTALALTLSSRGTILHREIICGSLHDLGLNREILCGGAIESIGRTYREEQQVLFENLFPQYFGYLPLLVLASLPIFLTSWFRENRLWVLTIFLFSAPLYSVGWDYGRWINIFIIQITILFISKGTERKTHTAWNPLSVVLFVTLWGVPHYGYIAWGANSALRQFESFFY